MRNGIICGGSWIVDRLKFVETYPSTGNLTQILSESRAGGGGSHNVSGDLARLRTDIPIYAAGCVGMDGEGDFILDELHEWAIDDRYIERVEGLATSYCDVMIPADGSSRTFFHYHGANAAFGLEQIGKIDVPAKIFQLTYLLLLDKLEVPDPEYGILTARALDMLQRKGYKTSVDVVSEESDRYLSLVLPCLPYIDYLIFNDVEAGKCYGHPLRDESGRISLDEVARAAACMLDRGVREVCVIHFPEGGFRMDKDGSSHFEPSVTVPADEMVSPVGAGDAFCAGMLYALHEGMSLRDSLVFANTSARFNLKHASCCGGAPALQQITEFIKLNCQSI